MRFFAGLITVIGILTTNLSALAQTNTYDGTGSHFSGIITADEQQQFLRSQARKQKTFDKLKASAERGNKNAMFDLGSLLHQGHLDGKPNILAAYDYYEKAATAGEYRAHILLCPAYLLGINRPVDVVKAMNTHCAKLKPEQPALLFSGAYDYEHGLSGPKDEVEALQLYVAAAKAGSSDAMNWLGLKALNELGKDEVARQWFRRAAAEGSSDAMFNLAEMTGAGRGGFKDEKEATWLYVNAARKGHEGASAWLQALNAPPEPLLRSSLMMPPTKITQTVQDKDGEKTRPFDVDSQLKYYNNLIPAAALPEGIDGEASVHCYVTAELVVDLCLTLEEFPIGYNYAAVLQGIFGGKITTPAIDSKGLPTPHTIITLKYRWLFNEAFH